MRTLIIITIGVIFSACNYVDLGGMFIVNESVNERFSQVSTLNNFDKKPSILSSTNNYNIFVMADVHIGETKNFDVAIDKIKADNASAIILNGDICNGNSYNYDSLEVHLKNITNIPYFTLVGNHELYFGGWKEYFSRFGSSTYSFTVKTPDSEDLFICLDTGSGTLGSKQLSWFKNLLNQKRANYRNCIVFTHNNLYRIRHTLSTNPVNDELLELTNLFTQYNVDMVIAGHDHLKNIVQLGNTTHITLNAMLDGFPYAGYLKIAINSDKINYEFINL